MPTCAVDRVFIAQNGCQPRLSLVTLAVDRGYKAVDGLGRQQVLACTVCCITGSVDSTGSTNGITITPMYRQQKKINMVRI